MKTFVYQTIILVTLCFLSSCSFLEDDSLTPIEKERLELEESIHSYKVLLWKYFKMSYKASYVSEETYPELLPIKEKLGNIQQFSQLYDKKLKNDELTALDYIDLYKDFMQIKDFIKETDEDVLPSIFEFDTDRKKQYSAEEIRQQKSLEHLLFSIASILSKDLGREIAIYEIMKIDIENTPESEAKCLFRYIRAILYVEKGLTYLAEEDLTQNIQYIEKSGNIDFSEYYQYLHGKNTSKRQAYDVSLAIHYLLRGVDRLLIGDEKEQGALEDFQAFLNIMNHLGIQTELTLAVETYIHLKNEDAEKAIASLQLLKQSTMLSEKEKKTIDESIGYLQNRESGKVLNSVYDKYFLSKIVTKYTWNTVKELNWKHFMKKQGFENVDATFDKIEATKEFIENLEKYTTEDGLKAAEEQLKEGGEELWDKAKKYWNEN
ncbi:tetratricopeptide repeat protein [Kordia jejudonensis]|uniref:hypothetical protein n=1 Tax=Kordia jejudonensis TaxID=1348245 RepID=UPI0006292317|nr:hypothetical protein [Kordia jejudonensis]